MDALQIVIGVVCIAISSAVFVYFWRIDKKLDRVTGTLRIDCSDPDGPYMFLELTEPVEAILNAEYVTLKVNKESYISQK